jgi:hypothetical protein
MTATDGGTHVCDFRKPDGSFCREHPNGKHQRCTEHRQRKVSTVTFNSKHQRQSAKVEVTEAVSEE